MIASPMSTTIWQLDLFVLVKQTVNWDDWGERITIRMSIAEPHWCHINSPSFRRVPLNPMIYHRCHPKICHFVVFLTFRNPNFISVVLALSFIYHIHWLNQETLKTTIFVGTSITVGGCISHNIPLNLIWIGWCPWNRFLVKLVRSPQVNPILVLNPMCLFHKLSQNIPSIPWFHANMMMIISQLYRHISWWNPYLGVHLGLLMGQFLRQPYIIINWDMGATITD